MSTTSTQEKPTASFPDLLAAPVGSLRVDDVYALQNYARALDAEAKRAAAEAQRQIDQRIADTHDAARMREIDAVVAGGGLLDRERLRGRAVALGERNTTWHDDAADLAIETNLAFAAAMLTERAIRAADDACTTDEAATEVGWRIGIRAAMREAAGVEVPQPQERETVNGRNVLQWYDTAATFSERLDKAQDALATEKARADKAEADLATEKVFHEATLRGQESAVKRASEAENGMRAFKRSAEDLAGDLAALEQVIAETSHAAGISGTMTQAGRVRIMASRLTQMTEAAEKAETNARAAIRLGDQARAEADALRAEVAALRGLAESADVAAVLIGAARDGCPRAMIHETLRTCFATVPHAKVADAVKPERCGICKSPTRAEDWPQCTRENGHDGDCVPEALPVLEPLDDVLRALEVRPGAREVQDGIFRECVRTVIARVNELSRRANGGAR
jgi:hypothetical protein